MNNFSDIASNPILKDSTLSIAVAKNCISSFMGHRISMIESLKEQNKHLVIPDIYEKAIIRIKDLEVRTIQGIRFRPDQQRLDKKQVKQLKKELSKTEKAINTIIYKAQVEVLAELSQSPKTKAQVIQLATNNLKAKRITVIASVFKKSQSARALEAFTSAKQKMIEASRRSFDSQLTTQVDKDKSVEFTKGDLNRRADVIGIKGIYRIGVTFSKNEIKEQVKSFVAQNLSNREQQTLDKTVTLNDKEFTSLSVPLNNCFDDHIGSKKTKTSVFTNIFGNKVIASANRQEPHLVNAWETDLIYQGQTIFRALRHAILSDKYEKNPEIRNRNSKQAAEELLKAALLQEIASQGLTLQEAREKGLKAPLELNLNSISLITPDSVRPFINRFAFILRFFGIKIQSDERALLNDQVRALKSFSSAKMLNLDGIKIPVKVTTNTFNFGTNSGAVGIKVGPKKIRIGLEKQHSYNLKAWKNFKTQIKQSILNMSEEVYNPENQASLTLAFKNIKQLQEDIEILMKNKKAYLQGQNQYEIGSKILLLSYVMDQASEIINKRKTADSKIAGSKSAFNCMSGKDRTGVMDAMVKTFAVMSEENNGLYHSTQEILNNPELQEKFREVFVKLLLEGGGLEITESNTGSFGYKVGEEVRIFGMSLTDYMEVKGLSAVVAS